MYKERLMELGVPANLKGFEYMNDAISWYRPLMRMGTLMQNIADKYESNPSRVDRALRVAIANTKGPQTIGAFVSKYSILWNSDSTPNRNEVKSIAPQYTAQRKALITICGELGLDIFLPNYHADRTDKNTYFIYTNEAYNHNAKVDSQGGEYMDPVCTLENTDLNGYFSYDYMNCGKIDLRGLDWVGELKRYIEFKMKLKRG